MSKLQCPNCGGDAVEDLQKLSCVDYALIPVFGLGLLIILYKNRNRPKDGSHQYKCHYCEHNWNWKPGTPYPEIHVRPDLIAQGKKKQQDEISRDSSG